MKFKVDHDFHIHTYLSGCSNDPLQNPENILKLAKRDGLKSVCLTDHLWDTDAGACNEWYIGADIERSFRIKPLPESNDIKLFFGCETEIDMNGTIGLSQKRFDDYDFIIVPTTHLHMIGFTISEDDSKIPERRAQLWKSRFETALNAPLPFEKVGIAHLTCSLIGNKDFDRFKILSMISQNEFKALFLKAASKGCGIELNLCDFLDCNEKEFDWLIGFYSLAKDCGCKFYLGSDSHHPNGFDKRVETFEKVIDMLSLSCEDRFVFPKAK